MRDRIHNPHVRSSRANLGSSTHLRQLSLPTHYTHALRLIRSCTRLADGRAVRVADQDFISMHPTGRTVIVYGQNEDLEILDVMLITALQLPGKVAKSK